METAIVQLETETVCYCPKCDKRGVFCPDGTIEYECGTWADLPNRRGEAVFTFGEDCHGA